ncbi:GTP-binding protein [Mycobacterium cookii]|uniref:Putative cobalamin synthesis protein n=1 Tax=Mycobacterium cookii TaxID=1775 RepID=A0A7I7KZP4_9MYCO|nr:GTP-binding protein [Mycobacterium cookii]MCV7330535.1 GTP-binding protein [Mycobacterium cookii]BBX47274.1 putative cobalamin synthesis protein [Mycobacterium cookii]
MRSIPVICLTGHLGAGKTSLLNHVLSAPGARIGVIVNDFGELNVDAMLVSGQIDEPVSIAGGCICCLPDDGGIDEALAKLADARLDLDAVIVETSGLADPVAVVRMIGFSEVTGVRFGGLVDVIDATTHFDTIDVGEVVPARYGAASLVVVNKLDQLPGGDRTVVVDRVKQRVRERNSRASVVGTVGGRIDPGLLYDIAESRDVIGQLSLRELFVEAADHAHLHADSVSATSDGEIDPGALLDLLEDPPSGVYRLKGAVVMRYGSAAPTFAVNLVGTSIHIANAPAGASANCLVAIGMDLDTEAVSERLATVLRPTVEPATLANAHRLRQYRRRSL